MKSKLKIITAFIIGAVVFGSLGVYAASKIYSNQVEIDKTGGKLANVNGTKLQDALDYLYSKASMVGECPNGYVCVTPSFYTLSVGDLISMTPTLSTFTTDKSMTGYTSAQTINPQELNLWRVIRKNSDGTVDVVSEYVSSVQIYFSGVNGYKNFIGYLNTLASKYENSNYTVGSRHMGYDSTKATEILTSTTRYDGTSSPSCGPIGTSETTTAEQEAVGYGDMGYQIDYNLVVNAYKNTTIGGTTGNVKAYMVGTTSPRNYWLASRYHYEYCSGFSMYADFYGRIGSDSGGISVYDIRTYSPGWKDETHAAAIRPILTLKSNINIISGDGNSEATAYVLG